MKNTGFALLAVCLMQLLPASSPAEVNMQIDVLPASIFANINSKEFSIQNGTSGTKESMSLLSSLPNISLGIAADSSPVILEFKGGIGMLLNSRMSSLMLSGTAGATLEIKPSVFMGAHLTLAYMSDPSWWGDGKVDLKAKNPAVGVGLHATVGDKVAYLLSIDYMSMSFDATGLDGWTTSRSKLDMSGIAIQFGVRATF